MDNRSHPRSSNTIMASRQDDIAAQLLLSADARIAEAARRVFSSGLPGAAACLAAPSASPAGVIGNAAAVAAAPLARLPGVRPGPLPTWTSAGPPVLSIPARAPQSQQLGEVAGLDAAPASKKLERVRERNRAHARKARQRKKEHMRTLQVRRE